MLTSLKVKNFTVFPAADFQFASGLNVIVGENGSGKTHLLKLAYSLLAVVQKEPSDAGSLAPGRNKLQHDIAETLRGVFRPDGLGRLARRNRPGRQSCEVSCVYSAGNELAFSFSTASTEEVKVTNLPTWIEKRPVYLPTRELLSIAPGFVSLYETTSLEFDKTWRDTCLLLELPLARGPREKQIKALLLPIEEALGGKVEEKNGRFYLSLDGVPMEMHLVAEGLRKLAMIARLIATGSLVDKGYLFWDEPEANLNPKVIKLIARVVLRLCQSGIQIFLASHSLFLLREIDILLGNREFSKVPRRFFGLHKGEDGVTVQCGETVDDIGEITSLQEELSQSERYLKAESAAGASAEAGR